MAWTWLGELYAACLRMWGVRPTHAPPAARQRCAALLAATSRSFMRVIQELPHPLRDAITVFYLVLRGLDTVEDDMALAAERKGALLRGFHAQLATRGWRLTEVGARDRALLANFDAVIDELAALPAGAQDVIRSVTRTMGAGMAGFAERGGHIETVDAYNEYCYYVAGLVGQGLTQLFVEMGGEAGDRQVLEDEAVTMGLFLQKINIIRDCWEDFGEHRVFWPREIWGKYADDYGALLGGRGGEQGLACVSEMVADALGHVPGCLAYLWSIEDGAVLRFCAVPQAMAIATLALVFRNGEVLRRNVKIRRAEAYQIMAGVRDREGVCRVFQKYVREIHRKNVAGDPNFVRVSVACGRIEQWIGGVCGGRGAGVCVGEAWPLFVLAAAVVGAVGLLMGCGAALPRHARCGQSPSSNRLLLSSVFPWQPLPGSRAGKAAWAVGGGDAGVGCADPLARGDGPCVQGRLATAGGDGSVRVCGQRRMWRALCMSPIWRVVRSLGADLGQPLRVVYLSTLSKHTQAVNVVRFSPQGGKLASGGDDGYVFIWVPADSTQLPVCSVDGDVLDKETWRILRCCRSAGAEIYDLAWSPDSLYLLTGSMDHIARIYTVSEGQCIYQLTEHDHYIQGVAWDPLNMYLATTGSDRTLQLYRVETTAGLQVTPYASFSRIELPGAVGSYHNETLLSFFRRLSFTPDGSLLLVPAGQYRKVGESDEMLHTVYIYTRAGLTQSPVAHVSGYKRPAIAISCSPKYYTLRNISQALNMVGNNTLVPSSHEKTDSVVSGLVLESDLDSVLGVSSNTVFDGSSDLSFDDSIPDGALHATSCISLSNVSSNALSCTFSLLYRMIYAVATQDTVVLYDTQQATPLGVLTNLHYATLTDLAWSFDGNALLMTSTDGFCSIVMFDENELGEEYTGPCPSLHVDKSVALKDVLRTSVDCSNSMVDNFCHLTTETRSIEKGNSLNDVEKNPSLTVTSVKDKKKRIVPTLVQVFERK
ncbi:hypothetical protein PMAC_000053 [Pneumocystis sp. 'macacae']|nr:hypothetical protein PMAC_000053 [Pneumocystis sp. 'macacae']